MFYPADSLKRGGRFYLCWLADSWPERFAAITRRQLWSHDIRKICDDLLKVITNESGRPVNRFSLRLSSQLMRGLVRLYQRKVNLYLVDLCMTNANVFKHTNKKWHIIEEGVIEDVLQHLPMLVQAQELPEEPENDQQVAQLIQNSGNVVANVQDITLKESVIPDIQLPPNDGFGEENQEQVLRLALDWPVEAMLAADASAQQVSALSAALDLTDLDLSARRPAQADATMEPAVELDVTMFNKSIDPELLAARNFDKDVPEIPEIPIPEMPDPVPQAEKQSPERPIAEVPMLVEEPTESVQKVPETQIELLELEEIPAKRRRKHKLIIDKTKKIDPRVLHARINNPGVELRCEDAIDDIIPIRIPVNHYFRRLAHAGNKFKANIANELTRLFLRNLGVVPNQLAEDREMEQARVQRLLRHAERSVLERIEEETEIHDKTAPQLIDQQIDQPVEMDTTKNATYVIEPMQLEQPVQVDVSIEQPMQVDISDVLTQKLETLSQAKKRRTDAETSARKRLRPSDYKSFSLSQQKAAEAEIQAEIDIAEAEKENIPINQQSPIKSPLKSQRNVLSMLEQAGIADICEPRTETTIDPSRKETGIDPSRSETAKRDSEGSETPLGSLDRTKVSLGDSDKTTDSIRFIREQWGTVGTMTKIMRALKAAPNRPITVWNLMSRGPVVSEHKNVIAARCFSSILKLKQHGFIIIRKDPDTLEITNIILGPRFD